MADAERAGAAAIHGAGGQRERPGRHVAAELVGKWQAPLARAHEDLDRAERTGGKHDDPRRHGAQRHRLVALGEGAQHDPPAGRSGGLDVAHRGRGEERGTRLRRSREIARGDRRHGADIAAGEAVATASARRRGRRSATLAAVELDVQGQGIDCAGEAGRRRLEALKPRRLHRLRQRSGCEHPARALEAEAQVMVGAQRHGPAVVLEHEHVRVERHAGPDERAAAEASTTEHGDPAAPCRRCTRSARCGHDHARGSRGEGVEPVLATSTAAAGAPEHVGAKVGIAARELAGEHLAAALEHGDRQAEPRQTTGSDAAAVAGADHDRIVAGLEHRHRTREARH